MSTARPRTAEQAPSADPAYERRFHAGTQEEKVAAWERAGLCCFCGHALAGHAFGPCDHEVRDYGEMDCNCERYAPAEADRG
jgi:hypothetical protein